MTNTLFVNLYGGPCAGKCFLKDTLIVMSDGSLKEIQNIKKGEFIMGIDSLPKKVLNIHNGIDMMYTVTHYDSLPYVVNSNHLITLKRTLGSYYKNRKGIKLKRYPEYGDIIHIPVKELLLKSSKFFRCFKGFKVLTDFKQKDISIDPYFLGLWLGDGCKNLISICTADIEIKNYIYNIANKYNLNVKDYKKTNNNGIDFRITSNLQISKNNLLKEFQKLNLIKNKHIPDNYLYNTKEIRLQILAGLIDTDGNLSKNCFNIVQKSKILAYQIKRLCDTLGFKTSITKIKKEIKSINFIGTYYNINISGNIDIIPTKLKRKKACPSFKKDTNVYGIKNISKYGINKYYGIQVEDEQLLLKDNLVAHNSTIAAHLFAELKWNHISTELIAEYAKQMVWEESLAKLKNQVYILGKQHNKQFMLNGKVDVAVTDSPFILSLIYDSNGTEYLKEMAMSEFKKLRNINIFLERLDEYDPNGRTQKTIDDAIIKDIEIKEFLNNNDIEYISISATRENVPVILDIIKRELTMNDNN